MKITRICVDKAIALGRRCRSRTEDYHILGAALDWTGLEATQHRKLVPAGLKFIQARLFRLIHFCSAKGQNKKDAEVPGGLIAGPVTLYDALHFTCLCDDCASLVGDRCAAQCRGLRRQKALQRAPAQETENRSPVGDPGRGGHSRPGPTSIAPTPPEPPTRTSLLLASGAFVRHQLTNVTARP